MILYGYTVCLVCSSFLISLFNLWFGLSENVLKSVIVVWLLPQNRKLNMKKVEGYFDFICIITFKKVDINSICFITCTFKKVAIIASSV